jgi:hypothetical protein
VAHIWEVALSKEVTVIADSRREAMQRAETQNRAKAVSAKDLGPIAAKFVHDCPICIYLGSAIVGRRPYDCYVHVLSGEVWLKARYGNDPSECYSRPLSRLLKAIQRNGSDAAEEAILDAYDLYRNKEAKLS